MIKFDSEKLDINKCECGGGIHKVLVITSKRKDKVKCFSCGKETKYYPTEEQAITAWNERRGSK